MVVKRKPRPRRAMDQALYGVIRFVRPLYRACAKAVEDRLEGTGITVGMRAVIEQLDDHGPQTVPQIGRAMGIRRQYIQCVVNSARGLGLMRTVPNPAHKRSVLVELTPAGRRAFERIRAREQQVLRRIARGVTAGDVEACTRVMRTLTEAFEEIAWEEQEDG